jgi:ATP-binding cassette subfamily B protein
MIKLFTTYLKPYWKQLVLVLSLVLMQAMGNLFLPDLNAKIINEGVAKGDIATIVRYGVIMLLVSIVVGAISIISVYWGSKTAMAFGRDLRSAIFRRVEAFSQTEVNFFGTPSLITRNTNDVQQVQQLVVMGLNMMIMAPITAIGGVIMAVRMDVPLSLALVIIIPLMLGVIGTLLTRALPLFKSMQLKVDRVNQVTRETLSGIRVIRAFVRTKHEEERFDRANRDLTDTALAVAYLFAIMIPALMGIMNLSTVAIMWFGGLRVASGAMPIGNLTAFISYIFLILMSVTMAVMMFAMVPRAAASAERIRAVLDMEPSVTDPEGVLPVCEGAGYIEFENVEFRYPGAEDPVLCSISFSAKPGETTAIVGSTGSGKSTLINLIPRFYDVTGGRVLVDGVDVREMRREDLWRKVGFIPQRAFLFSGSVASNLRYGSEHAPEDELWRVLEVAQGSEFVAEMNEQLNAPIMQGGSNVSGGQRQRLAIARALIKRPEIYVFDDSFSALDFKTDSNLREALVNETKNATVIIVAQRVSTIMHADRIIVMENGTIAGIGTHDELMESSETYREIVYSQLSQEEIA